MYCKKCGAEIADDSTYCSKCGQSQNLQKADKNNKMTIGEKIGLFIALTIIFILIFLMFILPLMFPYGIARGFVRKANNEDIEIDYELNLSSLAFEIVITPNKDIKELEIYVYFENEVGQRVYSKTETVGNVKEGIQVREQFNVSEYSALEMLECEKIVVVVSDGYVPYLQ